MKRAAVVAAALIAAQPATAAHCPQGQIYRVHLDECVGARSALARGYVHPPGRRNIPAARISLTRHVSDADQPPPEPPPPPAPDVQAAAVSPLILPDLDDGAPTIWRLCQAAPNLCKAAK